jgi:ATP-dependent RNA circularization protein (DNA/RNA ligase family)
MRKYMDVIRHGKTGTNYTFEGNPQIVVQEKLDGSNSSFKREGDSILCFSRNTQLNEHNTLRGFYNWVQENLKAEDLVEGAVYYGEWLVPHTLRYGDNANKFYLFDIYDEETDRFVNFDLVKYQAEILGLNLVPLFYEGEYQSLEHIQSFVGKSKLGEVGEGVVVKNVNYTDKHGKQLFTKFVSDQFSEVAKVKQHKVNTQNDALQEFVNSTVTKARVSKIVHKLVDEGLLNEDYAIEDMGAILKNTGVRVFEDVIKEELDELLKLLKGKIGKKLPSIVKEVLADENRM